MRKEPTNWLPQGGLMEGSGKVVLTAVAMYVFSSVNLTNTNERSKNISN